MTIYSPLLLPANLSPDMSLDQQRAMVRESQEINGHLMGILSGQMRPDDALDIVAAAGIDPMVYAMSASHQLEEMIHRGQIPIC